MTQRIYTAAVTVLVISPEGKMIGYKSEDVSLKIDMKEFPEGNKEADKYMKGDVAAMLAAAASSVEDCFD